MMIRRSRAIGASLVVLGIVAVVLIPVMCSVVPYVYEQSIVRAIRETGGEVKISQMHFWYMPSAADSVFFNGRVTEVLLTDCQAGDSLVQAICNLEHMEELRLEHTSVTDEATAYLRLPESLHSVYLDGTAITDASVEHIAEAENLISVSITGTNITQAGYDALRKLRPEMDIYY